MSDDQFVNSGRHFPIKDIKSTKVIKGATFTWDSIAVFLVGLAILPFQLYVSLAVLAATAYFWISRKPYYVLIIDFKGSEIKALKSLMAGTSPEFTMPSFRHLRRNATPDN
ncbi:MAG: hypothetical protein IPJ18_09210 [Betaproteobacteria bacterium]|nr:hypothetical protein [Betaproteobacteria bacterium]